MTESLGEAALTAAQRDKLPASAFGLPKERRFPLHDAKHVRMAAAMFARAKIEQQDKLPLARRILEAAKKFGVAIAKDNPLNKYAGAQK